jgi:hypothetical protein
LFEARRLHDLGKLPDRAAASHEEHTETGQRQNGEQPDRARPVELSRSPE